MAFRRAVQGSRPPSAVANEDGGTAHLPVVDGENTTVDDRPQRTLVIWSADDDAAKPDRGYAEKVQPFTVAVSLDSGMTIVAEDVLAPHSDAAVSIVAYQVRDMLRPGCLFTGFRVFRSDPDNDVIRSTFAPQPRTGGQS